MPSFEAEIVREARTLTRLQARRRKARSVVRAIEKEIRASRRVLNKLMQAAKDPDRWQESGAASKVFGIKAGEK